MAHSLPFNLYHRRIAMATFAVHTIESAPTALQTTRTIMRSHRVAGQDAPLTHEMTLYAGPQDQDKLANIAPGLDLTVDYGWLWWIAQPLFALLFFFATGRLRICSML